MRYNIVINGDGLFDHTIKHDGTLVSSAVRGKPVLITDINIQAAARVVSNAQYFALFVLLMQLNKELKTPVVTGDVTWDEIVKGAK